MGYYPHYFQRFVKACKEMAEVGHRIIGGRGKRHVEGQEIRQHIDHYESNFKTKLADLEIHHDGSWTAKSHIFKPHGYVNGAVAATAPTLTASEGAML
jgi:hypothetical protein